MRLLLNKCSVDLLSRSSRGAWKNNASLKCLAAFLISLSSLSPAHRAFQPFASFNSPVAYKCRSFVKFSRKIFTLRLSAIKRLSWMFIDFFPFKEHPITICSSRLFLINSAYALLADCIRSYLKMSVDCGPVIDGFRTASPASSFNVWLRCIIAKRDASCGKYLKSGDEIRPELEITFFTCPLFSKPALRGSFWNFDANCSIFSDSKDLQLLMKVRMVVLHL